MTRSIGLDVHPTTVYVTVLNPSQDKLEQYEFPLETPALEAFLASLRPDDRVALEATGNTYYLYNRLKKVVDDVVVAETAKLKKLLGGAKTDRNDSGGLAYLAYIGALPTVWMPDERTQKSREFLQYRAGLVRDQTRYQNKIRSLLSKYNQKCPVADLRSNDAQLFLTKVKLNLPWLSREKLALLLEQMQAVSESLKRADDLVEALAAEHTETDLLATVPGVDSLLALTILACVGDIGRFPTPESLANYAGLVPSVHSSGVKKRHGKITRKGNRLLRWAATQAVQSLRKDPGPFRNLYRRLTRRGKHGRAVVACGRKLLVVLWHMLRTGEAFRGADPVRVERKKTRRQNRRSQARARLSDSRARHDRTLTANLAILRDLASQNKSATPIPEQLRPHFCARHADQLLRLRS